MNDLAARQRTHLQSVARWAARTREVLGPVMLTNGARVHFRPASSGVAMIGLLQERPQRGQGRLRDLARVAREFEQLFAIHCRDVPQGRVTDEKALQSFLIRDAYAHGRHLACLNAASADTDEPVDLVFVADEIPVPIERGKIVCDLLAVRKQGARWVPVVIELKSARMLKCLTKQVEDYAALIVQHLDVFAELFSAVLGECLSLTGPCEKWIVWPSVGSDRDPRGKDFLRRGIRLVSYRADNDGYAFSVGQGLAGHAS